VTESVHLSVTRVTDAVLLVFAVSRDTALWTLHFRRQMVMKRRLFVVLVPWIVLAHTGMAFAQGGGASSTGTIQGRVTDAQGAVLPGVTVTAASPALLGQQSGVTSDTGNYRFPAVPPGVYTVTFELAGFNIVKREGIQITLGFTANVNIELALATLQETVTVTGESPIIDTTATRTVQNFKAEQLASIPNGRDMWSLLAVTPAVQLSRIDVGGNRAGTQTGYTAYGLSGQVRVLIEGINTTEGTGGAGFYFDYGSLEEAFLGTAGQSAEMAVPGVQSQFVTQSGSNRFSGDFYQDWYNNNLVGSNLSDEVLAFGIREGSNEIQGYRDTALNVGGPIMRDKVWWHFAYRTQKNQVTQPNFRFEKTFDTELKNPSAKGTYQMNQNNKFIGYYQAGFKLQPNRLPFSGYFYDNAGETWIQDNLSWVYKAEWNGTISDKLYVEARYGDFGYYFPLLSNGDEPSFWRDTGLSELEGSYYTWQVDRDRKQWTGAGTYFLDTGAGSHTFKIGGGLEVEKAWEGYLAQAGSDPSAPYAQMDHQYANGVSNQVVFRIPTAINHLGGLHDNDDGNILSLSNLTTWGMFVSDSWALGRLTLNLGMRYDHYRSWTPEQFQPAWTTGPVVVQEATFAEASYVNWNSVVPRMGATFDLFGDGRTVLKANYGLFYQNPGVALAATANPNTPNKTETYAWNDLNGDKRWQPGEQGATPTATSLAGTVTVDPELKQPYTHDLGIFVERQLTESIGSRFGFVMKTEDDLWQSYQALRPSSAYTGAFPYVDIGTDGVRGTADDRTITLYGVPTSQLASFPNTNVIMNTGEYSRYKTLEGTVSRRYGNGWSLQAGASHTWLRDFPQDFPNNPNAPGVQDRSTWDFKLTGQWDGPWGLKFTPSLRHQSGPNYARNFTVTQASATPYGVTFAGGTTPAGTAAGNFIYASPVGGEPGTADDLWGFRQDNVTIIDVRSEKVFTLGGNVKLRAFIDLFNLTNSAAFETITQTTGANFRRPTAILAPFTSRIGFRFVW
jgi:hypothetical protein